MPVEPFRAWNHFVPEMHLKHFASSPGMIQRYSLLVSHESVRLWSESAIKKTAAHEHLYTRTDDEAESDEIEKWLCDEFEYPATEAYELAVSDSVMKPKHWKSLARLWVVQHSRTPAAYLSFKSYWDKQGDFFQSELEKVVKAYFDQRKAAGTYPVAERHPLGIGFPLRTQLLPTDDPGKTAVRAEAVIGRKLWLWSLKSRMADDSKSRALLEGFRWTILKAPRAFRWFTSDNPALMVRFDARGVAQYVTTGASIPGTAFVMPLSPGRLLYTRVGDSLPCRGTVLSEAEANALQHLIVRGAHRTVLSSYPDPQITKIRQRHIDSVAFANEKREWEQFHRGQSAAERFEQ